MPSRFRKHRPLLLALSRLKLLGQRMSRRLQIFFIVVRPTPKWSAAAFCVPPNIVESFSTVNSTRMIWPSFLVRQAKLFVSALNVQTLAATEVPSVRSASWLCPSLASFLQRRFEAFGHTMPSARHILRNVVCATPKCLAAPRCVEPNMQDTISNVNSTSTLFTPCMTLTCIFLNSFQVLPLKISTKRIRKKYKLKKKNTCLYTWRKKLENRKAYKLSRAQHQHERCR